jgi:hypothetical protein
MKKEVDQGDSTKVGRVCICRADGRAIERAEPRPRCWRRRRTVDWGSRRSSLLGQVEVTRPSGPSRDGQELVAALGWERDGPVDLRLTLPTAGLAMNRWAVTCVPLSRLVNGPH